MELAYFDLALGTSLGTALDFASKRDYSGSLAISIGVDALRLVWLNKVSLFSKCLLYGW